MKDKYMNTKVYTIDVEVGKKFAGICGVPFNDSRKGYLDDVIGFSRSYDTSDVSWFTESSEANKEFKELSVEFILRAAELEEKKPRTKVEYVQVLDCIFNLKSDYENGNLYHSYDGKEFSEIKGDERTVARCLVECNLYRRIETTMTEREAFVEALQELWIIDGVDGQEQVDKIVDSGLFKLVN